MKPCSCDQTWVRTAPRSLSPWVVHVVVAPCQSHCRCRIHKLAAVVQVLPAHKRCGISAHIAAVAAMLLVRLGRMDSSSGVAVRMPALVGVVGVVRIAASAGSLAVVVRNRVADESAESGQIAAAGEAVGSGCTGRCMHAGPALATTC